MYMMLLCCHYNDISYDVMLLCCHYADIFYDTYVFMISLVHMSLPFNPCYVAYLYFIFHTFYDLIVYILGFYLFTYKLNYM
ncbi:hypothetical protein GDO81_006121 [Engystomops pustulosus]|uniref:Uncharacterized protein n=1 Tax=Engystomops pustulosus TaxID=76066 RepID=A0AAV7CXU9_ENGPU|nr:hypothetical protein GDO81_006121 [Engystomops pustulosus]